MRIVPFGSTVLVFCLIVGCGGAGLVGGADPAASGSTPRLSFIEPVTPSPAFAEAIDRGTRTPGGLPGENYWQQSAAYEIEVRLIPDEERLEGLVRILYRNHSPSSLGSLRLELAQNVHRPDAARNEPMPPTEGVFLRRVSVEGENLVESQTTAPRYVVNGTQLAIYPPTELSPGSSSAIEIEWSASIPERGAGGRMGSSRDNLIYLAYWYPRLSVFDDVEGWHIDPFLGAGEFYNGFGSYDVTILAPPGWVITATGSLENAGDVLRPEIVNRLRSAAESDDVVEIIPAHEVDSVATLPGQELLEWHFRADRLNDFAFSATRRSIWEAARAPVGDRDGDGVVDYALVNALYRPEAQRWANVVRYGQTALSRISQITGYPYPWPHVTAIEGAPILSGGMEYPMMTLIGDYTSRSDAELCMVVAHEIAHMWVPMIVAVNERRHGWLDEGLTEYISGIVADEYFPGLANHADSRRVYLTAARRGVEDEILRWTDYLQPGLGWIAAVYSKPTVALAALRAVLGEEVFWASYRDFISTWAFRHPYPHDFFATFERVSGRDLAWFWRGWYLETWLLDQAIERVVQRDGRLFVQVENRGRIAMPVILAVQLEEGRTQFFEFPAENLWLNGEKTANLRIDVDGVVRLVEIDPEQVFPDVDRANNVWER